MVGTTYLRVLLIFKACNFPWFVGVGDDNGPSESITPFMAIQAPGCLATMWGDRYQADGNWGKSKLKPDFGWGKRLTLNERQLAGPWVNAMLFNLVCFYPLSACDSGYILLLCFIIFSN